MQREYDVLVVGAGGAGMSAACAAADRGAKVLIVEAHKAAGGSTALSGGVFYAAGTSVQKKAGVQDSANAMYEYIMTLNQYKLHPSVVRKLCDRSAAAFEWLVEIGVEFPVEELYCSGVESVPRGHKPAAMGAGIAAALEGAVQHRGVDVVYNTRVTELVVEDGAVVGAVIDGQKIRTGAVVLATGGFGHNRLLLSKYYPEAMVHGDWTWAITAATTRGDGLLMGQAVGADIDGYNRGLLLPTPGFYKDLDVMLPSWLVLVNREGRRFVRENIEYAVMSGVIKDQLGGTCFAIFDDNARKHGKPDPTFAMAYKKGLLQFNWGTDRLDEQIKKGKVVQAQSIAELADKVGIAADALQHTLNRYNEDLARGMDSLFHKDAAQMVRVSEPPFYAAEIRPAVVCLTSTGLRTDDEARVLRASGIPIPGLFAAGEVSGSVHGERYAGGGNAVGNAVIYGLVAGENAAQHAKHH